MTDTRAKAVAISDHTKVPPAGKVSYEEFLEWADEDTLAEWVDGKIIMTRPASYRHQDISGWLVSVIRPFIEYKDLGKVFAAPFQMKLPEVPSPGREPDVLFVTKAHFDRLRPTYLDGAADLVIEIISPESETRDRQDKFADYQIGGVPEYWLIDPLHEQVTFYLLGADGQYQAIEPDNENIYHSHVLPGFWLKVNWLWRQPLPPVNRVLLQIGGAAYRAYLSQLEQEEI